jgi:hypothetical protein
MAIQSLAARQGSRSTTKQSGGGSGLDLQDPTTRKQVMQELGVEEPKPQVDLFGRVIGLLDSFRPTDDINYAMESGDVLGAIGGFLTDPLKKIGTLVTGNDYDSKDDKKGGADLLKNMGINDDSPLKGIGGFFLDVALDPTTYVTLGVGSGAKILTRAGAKTLTKSGTKLFQSATKEALQEVGKMGAKELAEVAAKEGMEHLAGKGAREIAEEFARRKVLSFAEDGVKVLKDVGLEESDKLVKQLLKEGVVDQGGFKFAGKKLFDIGEGSKAYTALKTFIDPLSTATEGVGKASGALRKAGAVGEKYGSMLDTAKEGVGNFVKNAVDTGRNLLDRRYNLTGGNAQRFGSLVDAVSRTEDYLGAQTGEVVSKFKKEYKDIIAAFENPEILPYIIENTPPEKLRALPQEIQEPLFRALKEIQPEDEVIATARAAIAPNIQAVKEVVEPEISSFVDQIADSKSYEDFTRKLSDPKQYEDILKDTDIGMGMNSDKAFNNAMNELSQKITDIDDPAQRQMVQDFVNRIAPAAETDFADAKDIVSGIKSVYGIEPTVKIPTPDDFVNVKRQINKLDPAKPNLEEFGGFREIVDKQGVKRRVFEGELTESQVKKLQAQGIDTVEDLVSKADNKGFKKSRLVEMPIIQTRTSPKLSRLAAGKEPEIRAITEKMKELTESTAYTTAKRDYDALLTQAKQAGYNRPEEFVDEFIGRAADNFDPESAKEIVKLDPSVQMFDQQVDDLVEANKELLEEINKAQEIGEIPPQLQQQFDTLQAEVDRIYAKQEEKIQSLIVDPQKYYDAEMGKIEKWRKIQDQAGKLDATRAEKIDGIIEKSKVTEEVSFNQPMRELSEYQQLAEELNMTPAQLDSTINKARKTLKEAQEKAGKAEVLLNQVYEVSSPLQREIIDRQLARITDNTQAMIDVGAIDDSAKANYIGREYLMTPGGKDLTQEKGGFLGLFGGSMKTKLDPRSVANQKARVYDYLADAVTAGGETTITAKGLTKEQTAAKLAEQLAKDEIKAISAKEFKTLADQIIGKQLTDGQGNALYNTVQDVVDDLIGKETDVPAKILDAVENFKQTGQMPEQLKSYFKEKGYQQLTQKGGGVIPAFKDVFFDPEAHQVLTNIHKSFFGDEDFNQIVRLYDKVQNTLKASQTAWFPAFHVRNAFSNVFGNAVAGLKDPRKYKDAIDLQRYGNLTEKLADAADDAARGKIQTALERIGDKAIDLGDGGTMKVAELFDLAKNNGVISGGFYADLADDIMGGKIAGVQSFNPLSRDFVLTQAGGKVGGMVEDNGRIALFLDGISKGYDIRSSALRVKEVLFDYSELTDFEKNIMKRMVPFYTWTKKNAALQMKRLVNQPGKYKAMIKGFEDVRDAFSNLTEEERDKLPDWAKQGVGLMFKTGDDSVSAITQFGLPHEAFQSLLNSNPLNNLGLVPKVAIELGTGQNIFKGKAILDDTDGKAFRSFPQFIKDRMGYREETRESKDGGKYTVYYVDPWAKYWVSNLLGRTQSTFSKISNVGAEGDAGADLLNIFSGVKKYDFNLTEEGEKRDREESKKLYQMLVDRGMASEFTNQTLTKETRDLLADMNK